VVSANASRCFAEVQKWPKSSEDEFAKYILSQGYKNLSPGGLMVVSSSNINMRGDQHNTDSLENFLIQHIGTRDDPFDGWGLNYRTIQQIETVLRNIGLVDIKIFDDDNYPGREKLPDSALYGVDPIPGIVAGCGPAKEPYILPRKEVLERRIGYNWIAIGMRPMSDGKIFQ